MDFLNRYFLNTPSKKDHNKAAIAYLAALDHLSEHHKEIADAIIQELKDQRSCLKLIASENYSSLSTQLAMGNLLTDKYAEGVIKKRFYAGCDNIDTVEVIAAERLKKLFNVDHAYVQPHSGADANLVAFWAILTEKIQNKELEKLSKKTVNDLSESEHEAIRQIMLNQKIMGMALDSGGHLTHGFKMNVSSKIFKAVSYKIDPQTELLDYKALADQVKKEKPLILIAGYSSYPRLLDFAALREIADSVGAVLMGDIAHFAGLVAGKAIVGDFDPSSFCDVITSTTHKTLRGPRGGLVMCKNWLKESVDKGCPLVLGGPLPHVIAAKAVAFKEAMEPSFREWSAQVLKNAKTLAESFLKENVKLFSGGTDNHLIVIDCQKSFGLSGRQAEGVLRGAGITVNRNMVPYDQNGAWYTSGIRIGSPAMTTLGMKEAEMKEIASFIIEVLKNAKFSSDATNDSRMKASCYLEENTKTKIKAQIQELLKKFPLYPEIVIE